MAAAPDRKTVDLSAYPDLVVIYLGMRVEEPRGIETLKALRPADRRHGRGAAGGADAARTARLRR